MKLNSLRSGPSFFPLRQFVLTAAAYIPPYDELDSMPSSFPDAVGEVPPYCEALSHLFFPFTVRSLGCDLTFLFSQTVLKLSRHRVRIESLFRAPTMEEQGFAFSFDSPRFSLTVGDNSFFSDNPFRAGFLSPRKTSLESLICYPPTAMDPVRFCFTRWSTFWHVACSQLPPCNDRRTRT